MDYRGTFEDDILDQAKLALPNWSIIYGGIGNDSITINIGGAVGEVGNDTIIGTSPLAFAVYWSSPNGVTVDLVKNIALDGYGTVDKLININNVTGSNYSDTLIGNTLNNNFAAGYGNDLIIGGGGYDVVTYSGIKSTDAEITCDASSDTFKVRKISLDDSIDTLIGIGGITFAGPGSDEITITKDNFGNFRKTITNGSAHSGLIFYGPNATGAKVGDYTVLNNDWGAYDLEINKDYTQSIAYSTSNLQSNVVFSWSYPEYGSKYGVWAYPEILWGAENGWGNLNHSHKVSELVNWSVGYDVTISGNTPRFSVMMEIFVTDRPWGTSNVANITEVAVEVHTQWRDPNTPFTYYSDDYISAATQRIYPNANLGTTTQPGYSVAIQTLEDSLSGTISFSEILASLVEKGIVNGENYISGVSMGSEVGVGIGTLQINRFAIMQTTTGDDTVSIDVGDDALDGGAGLDTAVYNTRYAAHNLAPVTGGFSISGPEGTDTISGFERLQFSDKKIAMDLAPSEHAGQALEFIGVLAPSLVHSPSIVGVILGLIDGGTSLQGVFQLAIDIGLVNDIAGSSSDAAVAQMAFRNVIGAEADAGMTDLLVSFMDGRNAHFSHADFLTVIAGMEINQVHIDLIGLQQTGVEFI
jgi:Ca2+-binding RTX toxin-like protein